MSSVDSDDDIIFIEECSSSVTKRSSPLRNCMDEPSCSSSASIPIAAKKRLSETTRSNSYERLLNLEEFVNTTHFTSENRQSSTTSAAQVDGADLVEHPPSENRRPPPVKIPRFVDVEDLGHLCANRDEVDEFLESGRRKVPKKKVLTEVQREKQLQKKRKAIEREISASTKSKCEKHMFCHVSRRIFDEFPETEVRTRMLFEDRNIQEQLICDEDRPNMQILWYRKCIEVVEVAGSVDKREYFSLQHLFAVVLSCDSFKELIRSNSMEDFIATQKLSFSVSNSTLVLIVLGKNSRQMFELSIELFDCYRTQLHYAHDAQEFATYLAQVTRALAKMNRHLANHDRLVVDVEKGVKDASPEDLVHDWWDKMLAVICRMQDAQRRAILAAYPNPFLASKRFQEIGYELAVRELSEVQCESGRRLGPVMAHRLFMILTDSSGMEIVG